MIDMRILLIAPESEAQRALGGWCHDAGHECVWAADARAAFGLHPRRHFDVILWDRAVPPSADVFIASLTEDRLQRPVVMVTGVGFDEDDEMNPAALAGQLRILADALDSDTVRHRSIVCHDLILKPSTREALRCGVNLGLTQTEYRVLECLVRHAGTIVTRRMLCSHVWSPEWHGVTNVVDVYVSRVRRKVDRGFDAPLVHTVRGFGYRLGPER